MLPKLCARSRPWGAGARPRALRLVQLALCACGAGCTDPSYVSLGGNVADLRRIDAGSTGAGSTGAGSADAGPSATCTPPAMSDSMPQPTLAGACADPTPPVETCELGPSSTSLTSLCASRTATACTAPVYATAASAESGALDAMLTELLRTCNEVQNVLRVRFEDGCATRFELSLPPSTLDVPACVAQRLEAVSYTCAASISCGVGKVFAVPTSAVEPDWY